MVDTHNLASGAPPHFWAAPRTSWLAISLMPVSHLLINDKCASLLYGRGGVCDHYRCAGLWSGRRRQPPRCNSTPRPPKLFFAMSRESSLEPGEIPAEEVHAIPGPSRTRRRASRPRARKRNGGRGRPEQLRPGRTSPNARPGNIDIGARGPARRMQSGAPTTCSPAHRHSRDRSRSRSLDRRRDGRSSSSSSRSRSRARGRSPIRERGRRRERSRSRSRGFAQVATTGARTAALDDAAQNAHAHLQALASSIRALTKAVALPDCLKYDNTPQRLALVSACARAPRAVRCSNHAALFQEL